MFLHDFPPLLPHLFLHSFFICFFSDCDSILAPRWHQIMLFLGCFSQCVFYLVFLTEFEGFLSSNRSGKSPPLRYFAPLVFGWFFLVSIPSMFVPFLRMLCAICTKFPLTTSSFRMVFLMQLVPINRKLSSHHFYYQCWWFPRKASPKYCLAPSNLSTRVPKNSIYAA